MMESRQPTTHEEAEERAVLPDDFAGIDAFATEAPELTAPPAPLFDEAPAMPEPAVATRPPVVPESAAIGPPVAPAPSREELLIDAVTQLQQTVQAVLTELRLPEDHPARRHFTLAQAQVERAWADKIGRAHV